MKQRILLPVCLLLLAGLGYAQQTEKCAATTVYNRQMVNPSTAAMYRQADAAASAWLADPQHLASAQKTNAVIHIPVVVHVVYKNTVQNVADSNIHSQIAVLNECFRKLNSNYSTTRAIFDTLGADVEIEFALATTDPNGNPTNGIVRVAAPSNAAFDPLFNNDKVKHAATGGSDAWPACRYLNFWVCDMSFFGITAVLGYAQFPGGDASTDGVVIQSEYFGRNSTPNYTGMTAVHESGHWFGLRHIWADEDACDSTDFVGDTPNCGAASESDCNKTKNSCSAEAPFWGSIDPPDMVENYMDYSSDACMTLFTKGQKLRMYSYLNTDPSRLALIQNNVNLCNQLVSVQEYQPAFGDHVSLWPNPAAGQVQVKLSGLSLEGMRYAIYNVAGSLVTEGTLETEQQTIHLQGLSKGLYLVKLYNQANSAVKKLLVE